MGGWGKTITRLIRILQASRKQRLIGIKGLLDGTSQTWWRRGGDNIFQKGGKTWDPGGRLARLVSRNRGIQDGEKPIGEAHPVSEINLSRDREKIAYAKRKFLRKRRR